MPRLFIGNREITPAIVRNISIISNQDKTITENGVYTADAGYTGLGEVTVNVPSKQPVIQQLSVSPTRTAQTIVAPVGVDGYSPINVAAVTSSIDSNIVAENIKKDVNILGVIGNYEGGTIPTGTLSIVTNGIYDVTDYASADVNIPEGGIGILREVSETGDYRIPTQSFTFVLPSNATNIDAYAMYHAFSSCTGLTSVNLSSLTTVKGVSAMQSAFDSCTNLTLIDLSSLTTISGSYGMSSAFQSCTGLTSVDLSSLTTISGYNAMEHAFRDCTGLTSVDLSSLTTVSNISAMQYAFSSCTGLTSVDLSSLTIVSGNSAMSSAFQSCIGLTSVDLSSLTTISGYYAMYYAFYRCTGLTSVDLSSLTTISGTYAMQYAFSGCTGLTSVDLSNLATISGSYAMNYTFQNCTKLTTLSFPALTSTSFGSYTNQFNNMLQGVTGCTVHFPSNLQSVIGSWSDVTAGFGGTNTTVLFDLPPTN